MNNNRDKEEYSEIMEYMRFYGNVRFATLTVFAALTGGILTFIFKGDSNLTPLLQFVFKIIGIFGTCTFWVAEVSAVILWLHFTVRAVALEKRLSYQIFSTMRGAPRFWFMPTTYSVSFLYFSVLVFWLLSIIFSEHFIEPPDTEGRRSHYHVNVNIPGGVYEYVINLKSRTEIKNFSV